MMILRGPDSMTINSVDCELSSSKECLACFQLYHIYSSPLSLSLSVQNMSKLALHKISILNFCSKSKIIFGNY